ncbi:MAG: hypothetical protein ACI9W4_002797 [Rhodothermales bacterium]
MKKFFALVVVLGLASTVYFLNGPYLFPTSVALGPCWKDWTSPSSYQARASPLKTLHFSVGGTDGRLCFGAPESRGRRLFGPTGIVPFGPLWRMGANEPTRLFLNGPLQFGTLRLEAGRYSLYAEPDAAAWTIFVTKSTWHWGNQISADVTSQSVGSIEVPVLRQGGHEESLRYKMENSTLIMAWGFTRIQIPLAAASR